MSDEPDDLEALAGEYVLGTLPDDERRAFARRLDEDADARRAVRAWEERLRPLADAVPPQAPPARVWSRIAAAIDADAARRSGEGAARADLVPAAALLAMRRSRGRWRANALLASALAALLLLFVAPTREPVAPPVPAAGESYLAIVDRGEALPALVVRVDLAAGLVRILDLAAEAPPERTLELWYVAEDAAPVSLGLVADGARPLPFAIAPGALLAVSVEPEGGSPTGAPTGEVVYTGRLVREE